MLPGSLGALPKVGGDSRKTETPDKLRAHPKNTWTSFCFQNQQHGEEEEVWHSGGRCPGSREVTMKWHSWRPMVGSPLCLPRGERDAKRITGLNRSLTGRPHTAMILDQSK